MGVRISPSVGPSSKVSVEDRPRGSAKGNLPMDSLTIGDSDVTSNHPEVATRLETALAAWERDVGPRKEKEKTGAK